MQTRISIIGLGWLGLPLAHHLQSQGFRVKGSVTSEEKSRRLSDAGVDNRVLRLGPEPSGTDFEYLFDTDVLVINIAPSISRGPGYDPELYPRQLAALQELVVQHGVKKVIYTSATFVYPDENKVVREADVLTAENTGSTQMFGAEAVLQGADEYALTILRLGGLIGYDRVPGRHFAGKEQVAGHPPVNYIHRDDAVRLIAWVIGQGRWGEIYNAVAPFHPTRKEVYERTAQLLGFALPQSWEEPAVMPWKEVSADKLVQAGFNFLYPDPLQFPYT
jgi:nucleoside-diphosphate-sugar epimerase